ncbi:DUF6339 family protein [Granulosicoccaceae sp. 1_MG-2023]|nr:DUF6339 family protein [Granulosicoccaceae sp. 1_MG-2023]
MKNVALLPRLSDQGVAMFKNSLRNKEIPEASFYAPYIWYASSGGSPSPTKSNEIADTIREFAMAAGFPESRGAKYAEFDQNVAVYLATNECFSSGEALRNDVWAYLAVVKLPDVVKWRFPSDASNRYLGGVKNAFQRLWIRGVAVDLGEEAPDRWKLLRALTEDASGQVLERTSIASDIRLARNIALVWLQVADKLGRGRMENVTRRAVKELRLLNEVVDLSSLPDDELLKRIIALFINASN